MKRVMRIQYVLPFILLLAVALVVVSGLALAQSAYSDSDNGKTITLKSGDTFTIRLDENPTTGYSWNMTADDGLQIVNDRYIPGASQAIGSGGYHEWTVKAVKNGTHKVSGVYKRPWETLAGNEQRFSMTAIVAGSKSSMTFPTLASFPGFNIKTDLFSLKAKNSSFGDVFKNFPQLNLFGHL